MPKHSLKRRHQRHHDLSLCWQDYPSDFLTREAAARMVSDEDIRQTLNETSSPPNECPSPNFVNRLKRRSSSMKLSELASSHSFHENEIIKLSPKRFFTQNTEFPLGSPLVSPSPWGHFVDMLCSSSPTDDRSTTQTHDLSLCEASFVPCCPSPRSRSRQDPRYFHPYNPSSRPHSKRFPVSSRRTPAKELEGFLLRVPDECSGGLLQEAEDALLGLSL